MAKCDVCGKGVDLPYNCRRCGGTYCSEHRLPENHSCTGLNEWNDPDGVFDSGFDDSVQNRGGGSSGLADRLPLNTGPGGVLGYFRGNVSYLFLGIMAITFLFQYVVLPLLGVSPPTIGNRGGDPLWRALFVLSSEHPEYVWTWVTSVFSHGGFGHIFGNGIVLFFFGPVVERQIGSRRFAALFLATGILAGLGQIALGFVLGDPVSGVLGASGAILAILGILTVLNPGLKVYLYFVLPIPIWLLTIGYAAISVFGLLATGQNVLGNVAHGAHLIGLVLGLAYGQRVKDQVRSPSDLRFGRGGGGMGGPGRGRF